MKKNKVLDYLPDYISSDIKKLQEIDKGIEETYVVELDNSRKIVIKIHSTDWYDSKKGFLAGPHLIKKVRKEYQDYPLPKILKISEGKENPYYIMDYVEHEDYTIKELPKNDQKKFAKDLGEYMAKLHSIKVDSSIGYGYAGFSDGHINVIDGCNSPQKLSSELIKTFSQDIEDGGFTKDNTNIEENRFDDIINKIKTVPEKITKNRQKFKCKEKSFCHTDYKKDNILRKDNNIRAIIDWALPIVHDPIFNIIKSEEKLFFDPHREDIKNLSKYFRSNYFKYQDIFSNFNSKNIERRFDLYRMYVSIEGMRNFPEWFKEKSQERKNLQEEYYKNIFLNKYEKLF